jgi:hypothetical protein
MKKPPNELPGGFFLLFGFLFQSEDHILICRISPSESMGVAQGDSDSGAKA